MIAARLAGGNLFFCFLWWGIFGWGFFWSTRSTRIFFEGILLWGILFFGGGGVGFGLKVLEKIKK